jgi:hypothetical protein
MEICPGILEATLLSTRMSGFSRHLQVSPGLHLSNSCQRLPVWQGPWGQNACCCQGRCWGLLLRI